MRPSHHEPAKLSGAVEVITNGAIWGGLQGGILGLISAAVAYKYWAPYKRLTPQFRSYIQLSFILVGGSLKVDKGLVKYERRIKYEAMLEQERQLELAAARGEYMSMDGRLSRN